MCGNEVAKEGSMERKYEVGQPIMFIDEHRKPHHALVLIWWHEVEHYKTPKEAIDAADGNLVDVQPDGTAKVKRDLREPGCNLVLVNPDPLKEDTYGRQIDRETSVVHLSNNPAKGNCWCWPDEVQ